MSAHIPGFERPLRRTETWTDKNGAIAGLDQALVGSEARWTNTLWRYRPPAGRE